MYSIDRMSRIKPVTPVVYNKDKPREEPIIRQERYHDYISRRYREDEEEKKCQHTP
jgi:hypothetical protein